MIRKGTTSYIKSLVVILNIFNKFQLIFITNQDILKFSGEI